MTTQIIGHLPVNISRNASAVEGLRWRAQRAKELARATLIAGSRCVEDPKTGVTTRIVEVTAQNTYDTIVSLAEGLEIAASLLEDRE